MNSPLPILLASDFPILRDSLKSHFEQVSGIEVVGCASNEAEVISLLQTLEPKLVVLDLNVEWNALCTLLDQIHTTRSVRSLIMSDVLDRSRSTFRPGKAGSRSPDTRCRSTRSASRLRRRRLATAQTTALVSAGASLLATSLCTRRILSSTLGGSTNG